MSYSSPSLLIIACAALFAAGCFVDRSPADVQIDAGGSRDAGGSLDGRVIEPDGSPERDAGRDGCVASAETCNGLDDDCDGTIDEELSQACSNACGSGTETCSAGTWVGCDAPAPAAETCNGLDDDCDGAIDEELSRACSNSCGSGTETCSAGAWGDCSARVPVAETCNGLDDDCDTVIDNGDVCSCAVHYNDGSTYLFCDMTARWTAARDACRAFGYELVTIESSEENTWVWNTARGLRNRDWWIGLNDRDTEGTWQWASGSTSTHREWGAGQPGGPVDQDCVALVDGSPGSYETAGKWNDTDCGSNLRYICEVR